MPITADSQAGTSPGQGMILVSDHGAAAAERRGESRAATIFTIGKVTAGENSRPCIVRDISEGGMRVQLVSPPPVGSRLLVEMRGLEPRFAHVRWVSGHDAGLAFEVRCSLQEVFAARSNRSGHRARQPRFTLRRPVGLVVDEAPVVADMADISVGGAKLVVADTLRMGGRGVLSLNMGIAHDCIAGEICWVGEGHCGFRFVLPISSILLATVLEAATV